ncbi:hypothetical protein Sar04_39320 [Salinispora arenicola]|uniref:Uncharacterized protein n=1 Tax=Salinispora arenicola TaxID=168697 RepID=A0A542XLK8_SALAC|nr:hypothetical protein FB564_1861 [Salinispora arenicola]GIM87196.1 hypothetical protein Sar04_39320 [Salinispora arenicola]
MLGEGECFGAAQYAIGVWVEAESGDLDGCGDHLVPFWRNVDHRQPTQGRTRGKQVAGYAWHETLAT